LKSLAFLLMLAVPAAYAQSTFSVGGNPGYQSPYVGQAQPMGYAPAGSYPMRPMPAGYPNSGMPMMPMGPGAPMPVGGGGGGGIPVGAIIGLVGMLFQAAAQSNKNKQQNGYANYEQDSYVQPEPVAQSEDYEQQPVQTVASAQQHRHNPDNEYFELETAAGEEESVAQTTHNNAKIHYSQDNSTGYSATDGKVYHKVSEQATATGTRSVYVSGPFDKIEGGIPNGIVLPDGNVKSPFSDYTVDVMKTPVNPGHIVTDPQVRKNFRIPGFNN
jgi:hypothetical protein